MPSPNLHLTFRDGGTGDAGDPYTGLDRFGRLVETLWKTGSTDQVRTKYGRNRFGGVVWRRDEEAHAQDVSTEDNYYGYDALQQVKQRQRGDLTGPAPDYTGITNLQQEAGWTHDATGNWAAYSNTSPTNGQTRTHNTANEITAISSSPGDVTPTYDPVGNMLTLPQAPGTSTDQYDLAWDAWNRLVKVSTAGMTMVTSYTYDGLTRRMTKTIGTDTRHYYYNSEWRSVEERMNDGSTIDRQFTWGLRDRWDLLRRKRSASGSLDEALYVLKDYLDPVAIVDESGAVVERYAYDAFGNVRFLQPDFTEWSDGVSPFDWEFLFHAEFRDSDTSLYNYGYRYYETKLGRWLSRDPISEEGGRNLYAMGRNNPVQFTDFMGLAPKPHSELHDRRCTCVCEYATDVIPKPPERGNPHGPTIKFDFTLLVKRAAAKTKVTKGVITFQYIETFKFPTKYNKDHGQLPNKPVDQAPIGDNSLSDCLHRDCIISAGSFPITDPIAVDRQQPQDLKIKIIFKNPDCLSQVKEASNVKPDFKFDFHFKYTPNPDKKGNGTAVYQLDGGGWVNIPIHA